LQVLRDKIADSYYKLTSQVDQIRAYVFDVVRSTVPKLELDEVFTSKEEIARDVKEQLTVSMETFGLSIIQTLLTDIEPAAKVKAAMNEINAATRLRSAAAQKAEADKIQVVKAAEADAEAKFLAGQGIARQRQAIINGLRESVKVWATHVVLTLSTKACMFSHHCLLHLNSAHLMVVYTLNMLS
jgi:regulator of protease activity HflC (stomatin/prohibitin superfamily)